MLKTTVLFPVCFSVLLMGCAHDREQVVKIEKVPLSIPGELLSCPFPPEYPAKPPGGDDGVTASLIIEQLYAAGFACKSNLETIAKLNGQ
jgi:hypothetical protein